MRDFLLAACLCLMVAVESTTIKFVKTKQGKDIPSEQLVFLVELFKLSVSYAIYVFQQKRWRARLSAERTRLLEERVFDNVSESGSHLEEEDGLGNSNIAWFFLPACLYAVSNNVTFAALELMSPAMFNLLMNMKIPITALMAWAFIGYKINTRLGISFIALFAGSAVATLKIENGSLDLEGSLYGLLLMLVYATCSAGGAVYTEYVTKMRFPMESMYLQNIKFCICSAAANVILMMIRGEIPYVRMEALHLASVLALGFNGLMTAAVLKYAGSILKTYSVSVAMFLSAFFTWLLFDKVLSWNFYFGAGICAVSVNLYAWEQMRKKNTNCVPAGHL